MPYMSINNKFKFIQIPQLTLNTLSVETDTSEDYTDYFNATWPKALEILKDLCE
jgi:hypothetical protein